MRLAFVATGGFDRSGRERVIPSLVWLVERLARHHEVTVFVLRYHDAPCRYELRGAVIRDLGRPEGSSQQQAALARAMAEEGPFDLVHAYWAQPAGRLAVPLARRLGLPSVVTLDSGEFVAIERAAYGLQRDLRGRWAVRLASRMAARVTVCSEFQARLARAHGIAPAVIPLGVDTNVFTRRTSEPPPAPVRLLHVASLNAVKDQATLLRAFAVLRSRGLDTRLDIVGEDTQGGQLAALARTLGVAANVTFHGFLPSDRLVPLYHAAHLFVLTSLHEAAGVVLLEAAACGVPSVGSGVGYIADWAPSRAVAVPPRSPDSLASAMASLIADTTERVRLSTAAADWAIDHDADWTASQFDSLYAGLTSAPRRTPSVRDWLAMVRAVPPS